MSVDSHDKHYIGTQAVDNVYSQGGDFWKTYMKARPKVPQSWFDRIFDYHAQNGGSFDVVHDAGAGAGIHSQRLAQRFKKVIVSDPSEQNIEAAKKILEGSQYEFHVNKVEESTLPPKSVDMVFGATMIHWTKLDDAIRSIEIQLKPNGSLILWHAGFPRFPFDPPVETAWDNLIHETLKIMGNLTKVDTPPSSLKVSGTGYDYIGLSDEIFKPGVLRIKINDDKSEAARGGIASRLYVAPDMRQWFHSQASSNAGEHDGFKWEDSEEWSFDADFDHVMAILTTYPADYESPQLKPLLERLREEMSTGKVVRAKWNVYAIMASKRHHDQPQLVC